ncbi:MAG: alanine racemase [Oscillospiraceae bacterium]|nr:alanine racemase [Oscillospiraceae bacterium]
MEFLKRTWAEVDLDLLAHNYHRIRERLPEKTGILAVVKADGYGHHDRFAAMELQELGVNWFGVSNLDEALSLRRCGVTGKILILGITPPEKADVLAAENITQIILSADYAARLSREAQKHGVTVEGHIKVDTGMRRIGFFVGEGIDPAGEIAAVSKLPGLSVQGIFSHFSSSDDLTPEGFAFTALQKKRFDDLIVRLGERGVSFPLRHLQNSAAILNLDCDYELARAGLILYGMSGGTIPGRELDLKPVMSIRSTVAMVKTVEPGEPVSYSRTYTTSAPTRVATVPIGYADGYLRMFSNRASVLIRGQRAPIIGNVCMDQMMVDVSHIPDVTEGDLVTVVGRDGEEEITFDELAAIAGTISYELVCLVGKRVPRVCRKNGKVVDVFDYLDL